MSRVRISGLNINMGLYVCVLCIIMILKVQETLCENIGDYDNGFNSTQCDDSVDRCIDDNGNVCANHGRCICGDCVCDGMYAGTFCSYLQSEDFCQKYRNCVRCKIYGLGPLSKEECKVCDNGAIYETVASLKLEGTPCIYMDVGCIESYEVAILPNNTAHIMVAESLRCGLLDEPSTPPGGRHGRRRGDSPVEVLYTTTETVEMATDASASSKDNKANTVSCDLHVPLLTAIYFVYFRW